MDKKDIERLKLRMIEEKAELEQLKASETETTKAVKLDQSTVGRLSRMDAMQSQAMAKEAKRRREIQRTRIEAALERIEEGNTDTAQTVMRRLTLND